MSLCCGVRASLYATDIDGMTGLARIAVACIFGAAWPRTHRVRSASRGPSHRRCASGSIENARKRQAFRDSGFVHVSQVISPDDINRMQELYWEGEMDLCGTDPADPETWCTRTKNKSGKGLLQMNNMQTLRQTLGFDNLLEKLHELVDGIFGAERWRVLPGDKVRSLTNFPVFRSSWNVPWHWHADAPLTAGDPPFLFAFVYLEAVLPQGGGTLMLAGWVLRAQALMSQSKQEPGKILQLDYKELVSALASEDVWLDELFQAGDATERVQRFVVEGHISEGIVMRVAELTGARGDVVLWDPRCLHTIAANMSERPRPLLRLKLQRILV